MFARSNPSTETGWEFTKDTVIRLQNQEMTRLQNCWGNRIRRTPKTLGFVEEFLNCWSSRRQFICKKSFVFGVHFGLEYNCTVFCFQALCVSQPQSLGDGCMLVFIGMPIWNRSPLDNKKQMISETGFTIPQTYHVNDTIPQ